METISIDSNTIVQLGVGFAIAYVVLRLVLDFLKPLLEKQFNIGNSVKTEQLCLDVQNRLIGAREEMLSVKKKVDDLYVWHNAKNQDGVFLWYVPTSLEKAIMSLADSIATQTEVLRGVVEFQKDTCKSMERIERRLDRENN